MTTLRMNQMGYMDDWLELSALHGLGQGEAEEVAKLRAQKAEVQAEIARLKSGGVPTPGGFQAVVAASERRTALPLPPPQPVWPRIVGGVAVLGLGAWLVSSMMKRRRR